MDPIDDLMESSSKDNERVEAMDLLEECWFFDNLLNRGARMLRCHSDPCPTTANFCKEMFETNQDGKTGKVTEGNMSHRNGLLRTPSLPPCFGTGVEVQVQENSSKVNKKLNRQSSYQNFSFLQTLASPSIVKKNEEDHQGKFSNAAKMKKDEKASHPSLLRTPSLPPGIGREGVLPEKHNDPKVTKLTRQASLNPSDLLPPRHSSKGITQSSSRQRPPRNIEEESIDTEGAKEMRRRYLKQKSLKKTMNDLEHEELQGFKDLGFSFDKESLDPTVVNILPGLQEKKKDDLEQKENVQRPYLSEAWFVQSCAPPRVPSWVAKSSAEDMKAQIKFWARNVASNVRQEC